MRVLLVHNNYSVKGGAEVFYKEVGRVLKDNGHDVHFFSALEPGMNKVGDMKYFPNPSSYAEPNIIKKVSRAYSVIYNLESKKCITKLIKKYKPDIVHVFGININLTPSVLDAAKSFSLPIVMSCNDYRHICGNYKLLHHNKVCFDCKGNNFLSIIKNRCAHDSISKSLITYVEVTTHNALDIWKKNIDCFLFASNFMEHVTRDFWGQGFISDLLLNPFSLSENFVEPFYDGDYYLYFGRLIEEKGILPLCNFFKENPTLKLKIIGDGPQLDEVQKFNDKYKNIEFLGPMWGDELKIIIRKSKSIIVPSIWHENFPYVILQSFAASKPVIGTKMGGIPEMIGEGADARGLLYDLNLSNSLQSAIFKFEDLSLEDKEKLGKNCLNYIKEKFSDEAFYNKLISIYGRFV